MGHDKAAHISAQLLDCGPFLAFTANPRDRNPSGCLSFDPDGDVWYLLIGTAAS